MKIVKTIRSTLKENKEMEAKCSEKKKSYLC